MGEKIKISLAAARVNAKLTQREAAEKAHISNKTLNNWENGRVDIPFAALETLSHIYGMPKEYIFTPTKST